MRIGYLAKKSLSLPEAFVDELLNNYSGELPKLLSYFPAAQMNPFQELLYARANEFGYMVLPFSSTDGLGTIHWPGRSVIHLHWISYVLQGIRNHEDGQNRIAEFTGMVQRWRELGNQVIWTMHNLIPHNSDYQDLECELRERLIANVDAIHIMNKDSFERAAPFYALPHEKTFYVPHPSYTGYYPNIVGQKAARSHLMLDPGAFYFLFFGALSPYKEIETIITAMKALSSDCPQARLIIAGFPSDKDYIHEISILAADAPNILMVPRKILTEEIQYFMNACDVNIVPYNTLNSGAAALAAAFRRHCLGPKDSGVPCIYGQDYPYLFAGGDLGSLLETMRSAVFNARQDSCKICYEPDSSRLFFNEFNNVLMYCR